MVRVIVAATPGPDVFAEPSTISMPVRDGRPLGDFTLARLKAANLGPITLCIMGHSTELAELAAHHGIEHVSGGSFGELATATLARHGDDTAILVDGRAGLISPTVLRAQLARHVASGAELTFAPFAARGLAGVVASLTALQRLSAAHTRQLQLDFVSDFFEFIDQSRAHYQAADADVEDRFSCLAVNLIPAAGSRARALAPYLLADDSEDYERVFDELAAASWQQWGSRRPSPAPERAKILFVNYNGNPYGATRLLELWLGRWNQTRFELVVTQPSENALLEQTRERYRTHYLQVRWPNAQYVPLAGRSWTDALSASRRILDEERPDLVWLHGFVPAMAVAARLTGIPSICFAQTPVFGANPALGALVLRSAALEASDLIIGCATSYEHALRQVFRPPAGRMTSSPVGLDTTLYDPARHDRAAARAKFGVPLEGPVVLSASALIPFKRPDVTVRSFHRLLARLPDATLVMAGAEVGPIKGYARTIQLLAEELGIGERVKLLGFVEDMPAMYAAADVLVHTSITEPFGMVITEAMAMGLPVVGMDAYGPGEQIVHGTTGYKIAPPGDPDVIAAALFEVLTRPDHAAELGRAGRARARELYDLERQVRTLEQTCLDVIAATSRAGAG